MNHTNTGGPAFPIFPDTATGHASAFPGMTLRDYFAAKAMQAEMTQGIHESDFLANGMPRLQHADAMLKAREA
jgi:hypothetical protein